MFTCEHINERLLDYLYGLVDEAEASKVSAHLATCPACSSALARVEGHKNLLARAARVIPTVPAFSLPGEHLAPIAASTTPVLAPISHPSPSLPFSAPAGPPRRSAMRRFWPAWTAAAAILVGALFANQTYRQGLTAQTAAVAQARQEVEAINAKYVQVPKLLEGTQQKVAEQARRDLPLRIQAHGSADYHTAIANTYPVVTQDLDGNPQKTPLHVEVVESASGKILHEEDLAFKGEGSVTIPAGLNIEKSAELVIQTTRSEIRQTLRRVEPTFATHLTLNKSLYQVGEVVFFRTLTLDRLSLKPPVQSIPLHFALVNTQGATVKQLEGQTGPGGISGGEFALTKELASGGYSLQVTTGKSASAMVLPQARAFELTRDESPQLALDRNLYKEGETIKGLFRAGKQANGAPTANQQVTGKITVDGKEVPQAGGKSLVKAVTDDQGNAVFQFKLPEQIEKGKAEVELEYQHEQKGVKVVQPIPVVASRVAIDMFPEGGDLIAGLPCKVYYRVKTPLGDSIDPEGRVLVLAGKTVIHRSERQAGVGFFSLTPDPKETYTVRIINQEGVTEIASPFRNLKIKSDGVNLHAPESVVNGASPIPMLLTNQGPGRRILLLTTCRGQIVDQQFVLLHQGPSFKTVPVASAAQGVLRVTAYDTSGGQLAPMAERLVYRSPDRRLDLAVTGVERTTAFLPGQVVRLGVECRDEKNGPAASWLGFAVVDEKFQADKNERGLNTHFYLAGDFGPSDDLDNSLLAVNDSPASKESLDLFLGTQGWRRFVREDALPMLAKLDEVEGAKGNEIPGAEGKTKERQAVVLPAFFSRENVAPEKLRVQYQSNLEQAVSELIEEARAERDELEARRARALQTLSSAREAFAGYEERTILWIRAGLWIVIAALLAIGSLFLAVGGMRVWRREESRSGALAGAFACLFAGFALYMIGTRLPAREPSGARHSKDADREMAQPWPELPKGVVAEEKTKKDSGRAEKAPGTFFAQVPPTLSSERADKKYGDKKWDMAVAAQTADLAKRSASRNFGYGGVGMGGFDPTSAKDTTAQFFLNEDIRARYEQLAAMQSSPAKTAKTGPQPKEQVPPAAPAPYTPPVDGSGKGKLSEAKTGWSLETFNSYVYQNRGQKSLDRQDTLLWNPLLFADNGQAQISFGLPQSHSTYRVLIFANSPTGRVGFYESRMQVGTPGKK